MKSNSVLATVLGLALVISLVAVAHAGDIFGNPSKFCKANDNFGVSHGKCTSCAARADSEADFFDCIDVDGGGEVPS